MNALQKVCIAIPIYKPFGLLADKERKSLSQCFTVLSGYPVVYFGPPQLDFKPYLSVANAHSVSAVAAQFSETYFADLAGYNKLLISAFFYKAFIKYDFMLIYQPDAWVFKDDLIYWCDKGFDYIGAPWFEGYMKPIENASIIGVGNGGLSLRKTKSYLKVLNSFAYISTPKQIWTSVSKGMRWYGFPISLLRYLANLTIKNNSFHWFNSFKGQEDSFWSDFVPKAFQWFKVADTRSATAFSFETCPEKLYELNERELPFGCHAWEKYNPEFWSQFIHI